MLQHLQDKLLRQVLSFLMAPTTLRFILKPDEPPSMGMVDCLRSRVQEVRRFLAPPAEVVPTIRGLVALLDVFPRDVFAHLALTSRVSARSLPALLLPRGSAQPSIPNMDHVVIRHTNEGTRVDMNLRDFLLVTFKFLGTQTDF